MKNKIFLLPNAFNCDNIHLLGCYLEDNFPNEIHRPVIRLHGQAVKTSPFHGGNTGSIPVGVIFIWCDSQVVRPRSATPLSPVQIRLAPLRGPFV